MRLQTSLLFGVVLVGCIHRNLCQDTLNLQPFPAFYENAGTTQIQVFRTNSTLELTVSVQTSSGTAQDPQDFSVPVSNVTFNAGSLTADIPLSLVDNNIVDGTKVFQIELTASGLINTLNETIYIVDDDGDRPFDCRRSGQNCANATVNKCYPNAHICKCSGTYEGVMCNFDPAAVPGTGPINCGSHGRVHWPNSPSTAECNCYPGYYGNLCQHPYIDVTCDRSSMTFIANPVGTFNGKIYVDGKLNVPDCHLQAIQGNSGGIQGYNLTLAHNSTTCSDVVPVDINGEVHYSRIFIIQYLPNIVTFVDQRIIVNCSLNGTNHVINATSLTASSNVDHFGTSGTKDQLSPALVQTVTDSGQVVTASTTVQINTRLCTTASVGYGLNGVEIRTITFKNSSLIANPRKWTIYSEGCRANDSASVLKETPNYPTSSDKRQIKFCFDAFRFSSSDWLVMELVLRICLNATDCSVRTCSASSVGKRAAGDEYQEEIMVERFHITEEQSENGGVKLGKSDNQNMSSLEFTAIVTSVGAVVIVLIIILFVILYKFVKGTPLPSKVAP